MQKIDQKDQLRTFQDLMTKRDGVKHKLFIPVAVREAACAIRIARWPQVVWAWSFVPARVRCGRASLLLLPWHAWRLRHSGEELDHQKTHPQEDMRKCAIASQTFYKKHALKGDLRLQDQANERWHLHLVRCVRRSRTECSCKPHAHHVSLRRSGDGNGPLNITKARNDTRIVQAARVLLEDGKKCMILTGDKDLTAVSTALELVRSKKGPTEYGTVFRVWQEAAATMGREAVPVMNLTTLQRFMYDLCSNECNPKQILGCDMRTLPRAQGKPNMRKLGVEQWLRRLQHERNIESNILGR